VSEATGHWPTVGKNYVRTTGNLEQSLAGVLLGRDWGAF
jgi:hypothetical protein